MGIYSRKEFASLCHTTAAVVSTNIQRGKIVEFEKTIDSDNAINKRFFNKYFKKHQEEIQASKRVKEIEQNYDDVVEKVVAKATQKTKETKTNAARKKQNKKAEESVDWDLRKKKAETLLKERQAEKEQMQLEKLAGKLMPVDLVFSIIKSHNTEIFATFHNDAENLASVYCDILAAGDRKKLSEISEKLSVKLNDAIKRSKEVALSSIEAAIDDYSETRNRGERK